MRKFISIILAFAMMLSLFVTSASASDSQYEEISFFLSQLGISQGVTGDENGNITRAEFAAMIVRGINMTSLSASAGSFEDCSDSPFEKEIYIAKALGITNGTSAITFSPESGVGYNAAAKMLVSALGYTAKAEAMGGYPSAYVRIANSLGLMSGADTSAETVSAKDAFIMIYNMMTADVAVADGIEDGNLTVTSRRGRNLLTENFDYTYVTGVIETVSGHGINFAGMENDCIQIGTEYLKSDYDYTQLLGYDADAWYDDNGYVRAVIPTSANDAVTISAENVTGYSNHTLTADDISSGKEKKYSLEKGFSFIQNGRLIAHTDDSFIFPEGSLRLIDNNGNGRYDFVIAEKIEYFVVSAINGVNKVIYDYNSVYPSISLESDDEYTVSLTVDGAPGAVYDLTENMVCEVLMSEDGKLCKIAATTSMVSGTVAEKGDDYVVIGGKSYKYTSYFLGTGLSLTIGSTYDVLLSTDGRIVSVAGSGADSMKYGFFMDCSLGSGLNAEAKIKLLTYNGDIAVYTLKDKITLDGTSAEATSVKGIFVDASGIPKYQVIRYKEKEGTITHIDTADTMGEQWVVDANEPENNSLTKFCEKLSVHYRSSVTFGIPNVSFKNAIIFNVPKALSTKEGEKYDDDLFMLGGTGDLTNDATYTVDVYDYDERYLPAVIVMYKTVDSSTLASPSSSSTGYVVRSITDAVDGDGNALKLLKLFGGGMYRQYFIDPDSYQAIVKKDAVPKRGDIVRITTDSKGYIVGLANDVSYNRDDGSIFVNYGQGGVSTVSYDYLSYYSGKVLAFGDGHIALEADNAPSSALSSGNVVNLALGTVKYVVYNVADDEIYAGNSASVVSKMTAGFENASRVVCKTSHYTVNTVYIYIEE